MVEAWDSAMGDSEIRERVWIRDGYRESNKSEKMVEREKKIWKKNGRERERERERGREYVKVVERNNKKIEEK